jgi:hypothetical protein
MPGDNTDELIIIVFDLPLITITETETVYQTQVTKDFYEKDGVYASTDDFLL